MTDTGTPSPGWRPERDVLEPEWGDEYLPISRAAAKRLVIEAVRQAGQPGANPTTEANMPAHPDHEPVSHGHLDYRLGHFATHDELDHRLHKLWEHVQRQDRKIEKLGDRMSKISDALADLDQATNEVAARLDALAGQIAVSDQAAADQITVQADRLRTLAADPNNPVPPVEPTPV